MKKVSIIFCLALLVSACTKDLSPEIILKQIKGIHLVEAPIARTMRVSAHFSSDQKGNIFENLAIEPIPISRESSNIIITDTIGFKPPSDDNSVTPSPAGINAVIDANIQPGDYYCQTYVRGKMTCERGAIGTHLKKSQLTTLASYPAADHFASAAYRNEIIIFQQSTTSIVTEVANYSTEGKTICVYNENGTIVVAQKN